MTIDEAYESLRRLRGRARTRTLYDDDLLQVLDEARRAPHWGYRAGGTVAGAYGYPASQMRLGAVRLPDGDYAVDADWGNAARGSSPVPGGGRRVSWERMAAQIVAGTLPPPDWWRLDGASVRRALAARRAEARREGAARWPITENEEKVLVTVEDSLAAHNCPHETQRVAGWWPAGQQAVAAGELRRAILRREPTLASYARAAVAAAVRRQQVACA